MHATILLNANENTQEVEKQEKMRFLRSLLEQIDLPISDIWDPDVLILDNSKLLNLLNLLNTYHIQVIDDNDGGMKVYVDNELIAIWYKASYKLKRDHSNPNQKKQLFLEMTINFWSLFDEK